MDYTKEFLLSVSVVFVSAGTTVISEHFVEGVILLLLGVAVFFGRGFYKKYFGNQ